MHVDMNSFFASCEVAMSGGRYTYAMPVVVTGDAEARHGIVLAATPSAKKKGLYAGMPLTEARARCPEGIYLTARMNRYVEYSRRFMSILQYYSPLVESGGLDEAYLDYSGCEGLFGPAPQAADTIRQRVKDELGLTVSVGVAPNKLLAKQGSDYRKPDAVTILTDENFRELLWPRDVSELMYVGPSSARRLRELQIFSIGDLARSPLSLLCSQFGTKSGHALWERANGIDLSPVVPVPSPLKSISNSGTLPRDLLTRAEISAALLTHAERVAFRLRAIGCRAGVVRVALRDNTLAYRCAQRRLSPPTDVTNEIYAAAQILADEIWRGERIRQVGLALGRFCPAEGEQMTLFDPETHAAAQVMDRCADAIRRRHGYASLVRASMLDTATANQISNEDKFAFSTNAYKLLDQTLL